MPFECFSDPAYFDMWAVRDIENRSFNEVVHVVDKKEAEYLVERLNTLEAFLHANNNASLPCLCEDCTRRTLGSCRPNTNSRVTACEGYTKSRQAVA